LTFNRAVTALSAVAQIVAAMDWTNNAAQSGIYNDAVQKGFVYQYEVWHAVHAFAPSDRHSFRSDGAFFSINTDRAECGV
jgi:hypothetical protein